MSVFGPLPHRAMLEGAMLGTVRDWLPTYLREIERLTGRTAGSLPDARSYGAVSESDAARWAEGQLPAIVVLSPGTDGEPVPLGGGPVGAAWSIGVGAVVAASTPAASRDLAGAYGAALRGLISQHGSLGGVAAGADWLGERYDDIDASKDRTLAACAVEFRVHVDIAVDASAGPGAPADDPPDWPLAETVTVTVNPSEDP